MVTLTAGSLNRLSVASTLIDAAIEIARGRKKTGVLLIAAAALSRKAPGLGTLTSIVVRLVRRLR